MSKKSKTFKLFMGALLLASGAGIFSMTSSVMHAIEEDGQPQEMHGQSYSDQTGLFLSMDEDGNIQYVKPALADVQEDTTLPEEKDEDMTFDVKVETADGQEVVVAQEETMEAAQEIVEQVENGQQVQPLTRSRATIDTSNAEVSVYTDDMLRATSKPSVVKWKNTGSTTSYTEDGTNISGYTASGYAADAAYLGTSGGKVKFKMAGVTGWVSASKVEIVTYTSKLNLSYYQASNGKFYHYISTNINGSGAASTQMVGYQPSYIKSGTKYYSYDGHYFYTSYETMTDDYKKGTYNNAVNPKNPYYNYYQYLSQRTETSFSASDMNAYIASHTTKKSKIYNKGSAFVNVQKYGANAALMMGLAINESGWGMSDIAQSKNNIFGLKAYDSSPGTSASTFASVEACINVYAKNYVSLGYISPFDWRYYGPHLGDKQSGMNVKYASDPYWGEKAAAQAWLLEDKVKKKDYQKYTIAIDTGKTTTSVYKDASTAKLYYQTGNENSKLIRQFPYVILGEVKNSKGTWYKIQTDEILKSDRSDVNTKSNGVYDFDKNYGYIKADSDILILDKIDDVVMEPENSEEPNSTPASVIKAAGYKTDGSYIKGISEGTKVSTLISNIKKQKGTKSVNVKNASGSTASSSSKMATGMKVIVNTGSSKTYAVVIMGDVNGDGSIGATDLYYVQRDIIGQKKLSGANLKAAQIANNAAGATSLYRIQQDILGIKKIAQ